MTTATGRVRTVRAGTTLLATAVTALVLVAGAIALVATLSAQLTSSGDALAQARVRDLLDVAAAGALPGTIETLDDESVAQVVDGQGEVLAASPNVAGRPAIVDDPGTPDDGGVTALEVRTVDGPDDDETERYRVWIGRGPSPDGPVTVLVGRSLESVGEATRTLRRALLVGVPLVLVLLAAAIWLVVGRALARIDHLTTTVAEIDEHDLHRRVPETGVDDEVGRLAVTMNRMLERLEDSSARQRAFVADASHDLQSPLTALRTRLEVAMAHPDGVDLDELGRKLLGEGAQMEALVQDLLQVAAGDQDRTASRDQLLDLDALVVEEVARLRTTTNVDLDTSEVSAAPVHGDSDELRRLVRNLLDNAIRHAARQVHVALVTGADAVVLDVVDDGPGVPEEDRPRIFDRFFRGDPARGRTEGRRGSGLGLAIARDLAARHGGTLELMPAAGTSGAHFRLSLPSAG
jgi:signal transduction histidine kinase